MERRSAAEKTSALKREQIVATMLPPVDGELDGAQHGPHDEQCEQDECGKGEQGDLEPHARVAWTLPHSGRG